MTKKVIEVEQLVKRFGNFVANDHLTFDVFEGEIFGFLGANGAGKTTAMRILCGLSTPTEGKLNVAGFDIYTQTEEIKRNIGYMSQKFSLYEDLTVQENINFYGGIYGMDKRTIQQKSDELFEKLGLGSVRHKLIGSLPLGWKQKLAFSVAIFHGPRIVFLDEPTGGVDPITRREFWTHINGMVERGVTVMVTTHFMDEAEYCDRMALMYQARVIALDTPDALKAAVALSPGEEPTMEQAFIRLIERSDAAESPGSPRLAT